VIGLIAGRFSKGERAQQRAKINLEDVSLSPKTQQRYHQALRKLLRFAEKATSTEELDDQMCNWMELCGKKGNPWFTLQMVCALFISFNQQLRG
jgi:hypothetical protein